MFVSLLGQEVQTWQTDCTYQAPGQKFVGCDERPVLSELYLDSSPYYNASSNEPINGDYAGYNFTGYMYQASVCTRAVNTSFYCTTDNEVFYGV